MYRFLLRPIWLMFHLVVVGAIVLMINLAFWQLDRLEQRREFNATVIERSEQRPVPFSTVLDRIESGDLDPDTAEWLPVTLSGAYLPDQIIEFNNSQGGRAGDDVLTALEPGDGTTVIVNRGFVPLGFDRPPAPQGEVEVVGFVRPSEARDRGGLTDADDGTPLSEVRRIDVPLIARQLPGDVAPVYVQLTSARPAVGTGDPEPVVLPDLDEGPHLSYAIQWFVFSIGVAVGWVLAVRRSLQQRRTDAESDRDGGASDDDAHPGARPVRVGSGGRTPVGSS